MLNPSKSSNPTLHNRTTQHNLNPYCSWQKHLNFFILLTSTFVHRVVSLSLFLHTSSTTSISVSLLFLFTSLLLSWKKLTILISQTTPLMDSSQNWLAFTLSNPPHHQNQDPSLSLFDSYNTNHSIQPQDDGGALSGTTCGLDLCMFSSVGPKLEDFLGCGSMSVGQFSSDTTTTQQSDVVVNGMYGSAVGGGESELKSIAASFLRGYSSLTDQITTAEADTTAAAASAMAVVPVTAQVDPPSAKKAVDTFGQRTSIYRGVTRHRWTGRYEAHLWDNSCRREGQSRKGRQVYLGGYDKEDKAARAYDLAALKYWGPTTTTNFPVANYEKELEEMKNMSRQEFVASLRRKSSGFSRGASIYRGVTRHHQHGRWQARIGRVAGNKDLYLGTFSTQEEAAEAYDIAAIKFRGLNAVTNFDMSRYDVKSIANSNLPIGGITGKSKQIASSESHSDNKSNSDGCRSDDRDLSSVTSVSFASQPSSSSTTLNFAMPPIKQDPSQDPYWSLHGFQSNDTNNKNNFTMYQTVGTNGFPFHGLTNLNMEFSGNNNGAYMQQQSGLIPFGTPMSLSSNSYDQSNISPSYGNWVAQSGHGFQSAKPNISLFQTPIYSME